MGATNKDWEKEKGQERKKKKEREKEKKEREKEKGKREREKGKERDKEKERKKERKRKKERERGRQFTTTTYGYRDHAYTSLDRLAHPIDSLEKKRRKKKVRIIPFVHIHIFQMCCDIFERGRRISLIK